MPRPTHVRRIDAVHQLLNKAEIELEACDDPRTHTIARNVKHLHRTLTSWFPDDDAGVPASFHDMIPNEDLATWIDG